MFAHFRIQACTRKRMFRRSISVCRFLVLFHIFLRLTVRPFRNCLLQVYTQPLRPSLRPPSPDGGTAFMAESPQSFLPSSAFRLIPPPHGCSDFTTDPTSVSDPTPPSMAAHSRVRRASLRLVQSRQFTFRSDRLVRQSASRTRPCWTPGSPYSSHLAYPLR